MNFVDPSGHNCKTPLEDAEICRTGYSDLGRSSGGARGGSSGGRCVNNCHPRGGGGKPEEEEDRCDRPLLCPGDTPELDGENIIELLMASLGVVYRGEELGYCIPTLQKDDDDYLCQGNGTYWDWWLNDYMPLFWKRYGDEIVNGYSLGTAVESVLARLGIAVMPPYLDSGLIFTINFGYSYFEEGNSVENSIARATVTVVQNLAVDTASLVVGGGAGLVAGGGCASSGVGITIATACYWGGFAVGYGVENALGSYASELVNRYILFPFIDGFTP